MKFTKKILSLLLALTMVLTLLPATVFAADSTSLMTLEELRTVNGAFTVEAYNLGQGFLVEPSLYEKEEGKCTAQITGEVLNSKNIDFTGDINGEGIVTYFSGLAFDDSLEAQYPEYLQPLADSGEISATNDDPDGFLSEFDYSMYSGWVYTIDSWFASWGANDSFPGQEITDYNTGAQITLGDVIRWHFTLYGYGADCGIAGNMMAESMGGNLFEQAEKSELIFILAAVNDYYGNLETDTVYETALAVAANPLATEAEIAAQEATLTAYIEDTFFGVENPEMPREPQSVSSVLNATLAQLATDVTAPAFGTGAGEWTVLSLARGGYYTQDHTYFAGYYDRIVKKVNELAASVNLNGALDKTKSTENSRLILALSAIGKDATSVGNWNLIKPYEDFNWIKKQGINGPVYALLALNSHNYQTMDTTIRQQCIDFILEKELADGGWAMSGKVADPDMTAMTLQALAPYRDMPAVAEAAEAAFNKLSAIQNDNGGYTSWGSVNSESCAQVIVACAAWGINPDADARFVKNGNSVVDALLAHYLETEAKFEHIVGDGSNAMATDQATYGLVAYDRFINGEPALYDYSDVTFDAVTVPEGAPAAALGLPEEVSNDIGTTFNANVTISKWDAGYKLLDMVMTVPAGLSVKSVTPTRLDGGTMSYHLGSDGKLRLVYFDANNNADITIKNDASGNTFPAEMFTVEFEVVGELEADTLLEIAITGMSLKTSSDSSDEDTQTVVDTSKATGKVNVVEGISFSAKKLYQGDAIDLIPADKMAVAVAVTGLDKDAAAPKLTFKSGEAEIVLTYSAEMHAKTGVHTYVALVDAAMEMESFTKKTNYVVAKDTASAALTFGETNGDNVVNAQDALAAVNAWLRKTEVTTDTQILVLNVNGDARINTFDALGIVESFVHNSEFSVVTNVLSLKPAATNN